MTREEFEKWSAAAALKFSDVQFKLSNDFNVINGVCNDEVFYESYKAGALAAFDLFAECVEALEVAAKQVTWVDEKNQQVILTYGFHIERCQKALASLQKKIEVGE